MGVVGLWWDRLGVGVGVVALSRLVGGVEEGMGWVSRCLR